MKIISAEKQGLIDEAARHGFEITSKQIDRWRADRLLPAPGRSSGGRGRGVRRPSAEGTAQQLMQLCKLLSEDRSLDRAAFRLWIDDYAIPLERLRRALANLAPNPKTVIGSSPDEIRAKSEEYAEKIRGARRVKPHIKKMIDEGRIQTVIEGFLSMGLGVPVESQDGKDLGAAFEEFAGLQPARVDHWEGQSPWLSGDTAPQLELAASLFRTVNPELAATASDEEFIRAREAFGSMMKTRRCAEFLQQLHGHNVFGFAAFTELPIGLPITYADPSALLALVALNRLEPQTIDTMIEVGKTLDKTLNDLREKIQRSNSLK